MSVRSLFIKPKKQGKLLAAPSGPLPPQSPERLFSLNALRRAWLKVKATGGGSGVDGVTLAKFEKDLESHLASLREEVLAGRYRPQRVQRVLVPKPKGGLRPLALWSVRDKVAQRVVYDCIEPYLERQFLPCSFGYRPGLGVSDAVAAVVTHRNQHRRWVADIDIKDCFDTLDPALMMKFVGRQIHDRLILKLIRAWLNARVFNALSGPQTKAGASQGAVISPLLANVYLHQIDLALTRQGHHLVRYADDMVICCRRKAQAQAALQACTEVLHTVKLSLSPRKSRVVHFDRGFTFLGVFFLRNEYFYL